MKRILHAGALIMSIMMIGGIAAAADPVVEEVTASDLAGGDWFPADTRVPGTLTFESGPGAPPAGTGSVELSTPSSTAKVQLFTDLYANTLLSNIDGIGYSTYRDLSATGAIYGVAALNMRVDLDGGGSADAYMVYEPYQDHGVAAVQTGVWQNWNAYRGGAAKWWINTSAGGCGQATPCTWQTIVGLFPNATVREGVNCGPGGVVVPCPGSLGVNQGSGNTGFRSNADALYVSVAGQLTTFDFEPDADGDGVGDGSDNCPSAANADQADADEDGAGDVCDPDDDNDGVADATDNCDFTPNPGQEDGDNDGIGNACDPDAVAPTNKDQCKKDGWKNFYVPRLFKNQGDCVSYVQTGK